MLAHFWLRKLKARLTPPPARPQRGRGGARFRPVLDGLEDRTAPAVGTVNSAADANIRDAVLTLREAIELVNRTLAYPDLTAAEQARIDTAASPSRDKIVFDIPPKVPEHVYYRDDGVVGQVTLTNRTRVADTHQLATFQDADLDDETVVGPGNRIDPDWPHSWWSIATPGFPLLNRAADIDGYTQGVGTPYAARPNDSADGNNAVLRVELTGSTETISILGTWQVPCTIRGLVINGAQGQGSNIFNVSLGINLNGSGGNVVAGNYIGTDVSGTLARPNYHGVVLAATAGSRVGYNPANPSYADRNIISGQTLGGVFIADRTYAPSVANTVAGNFIGVDRLGRPLGNGAHGIAIGGPDLGAYSNTVTQNTIAHNGGAGVWVFDDASHNNRIHANRIHHNGGLGIDLGGGYGWYNPNNVYAPGPDGVTPNDAGDADDGPNQLQNSPVITSVETTADFTAISGTFRGRPSTAYTLHFYASRHPDPSGFGEGEVYLGERTVQTDHTGELPFNGRPPGFGAAVPTPDPELRYYTATATDASGNTSEFSRYFWLDDPPPTAVAAIDFARSGDPALFREPAATVYFVGSDSFDPEGEPLTYLWEFGSATAWSLDPNPAFTFLTSGTHTVRLTVATPFGGRDTRTLSVTVHNAPPTAVAPPPVEGVTGQPLSFELAGTDPSRHDFISGFRYDIDWDGDGAVDETVERESGNGAGVVVTRTFSEPGTYTARLTVTDKDGGTSAPVSFTAHVNLHMTTPDGALLVGGTPAADRFAFDAVGGTTRVILNGIPLDKYVGEAFGPIIVYGGAGDDVFTVAAAPTGFLSLHGQDGSDDYIVHFGDLANPVTISDYGETGTDTLLVKGTAGNDVIRVKGGTVTRGDPVVETVYYPDTMDTTVDGGGGDDDIADPDSANLTLLGGPGNDTITIANTFGLVTADGGDGSDTYVVHAGNLQGPVTIADTGTAGTDGVTVAGTPGADTFAQTGDQIVANGGAVTLAGVDTLAIDGGGGDGDRYTVAGAPAVTPTVQGVADATVTGTAGADQFHVQPGPLPGQVTVRLNGRLIGTFTPTGRLVIDALGGDDDVQVTGSVAVPMWVYGGDGADRLKGGGGHDVLLGQGGDDLLVGGGGRDLLVGGTGADRLVGNADDDILLAGVLLFEANLGQLAAVMAEWTRTDTTAEERIHNLRAGGGLTGGVVLDGTTVANDTAADVLTGSSGYDWFLYDATRDRATDLTDEAFSRDLPFIEE